MTARSVALTAALTALFAVSGCFGPEPASVADDKPEAKAQPNLPVAPAPRAKKTKADLLVGKWKLVSQDGKLIIWMEQSRDGPEPPRVGTYRLDGEMIWLQTPATAAVDAATWSVRIETLTKDKLVTIA